MIPGCKDTTTIVHKCTENGKFCSNQSNATRPKQPDLIVHRVGKMTGIVESKIGNAAGDSHPGIAYNWATVGNGYVKIYISSTIVSQDGNKGRKAKISRAKI